MLEMDQTFEVTSLKMIYEKQTHKICSTFLVIKQIEVSSHPH